jgi:uncharacterized Zn finger protein
LFSFHWDYPEGFLPPSTYIFPGEIILAGQKNPDPFAELEWDTLEAWAGTRSLSRGRKYQHEKRVHDMVCGPEGTLIAWVDGTERYATRVTVSGDGTITSDCTCPVETGCKHAVAVILEYLSCRKVKKIIRSIQAGDPRFSLLQILPIPDPAADQEILPIVPERGQDLRKPNKGSRKKQVPFSHYLEGLPKDELVSILLDLSKEYPLVEQDIRDRKAAADADADPVFEALLSDIRNIAAGDVWSSSWNGESCIPDYSPVRKRMGTLLSMGFPDAVIIAGRVLLEKGIAQIEQSNDEGETAEEIASCMDIVFQALTKSSMPSHERILFAILADLEDGYDICRGAEKFWQEKFTVQEWGLVARSLLSRLAHKDYSPESKDFKAKFDRDNLVTWIVTALDNSDRKDEATHLCVVEAGKTDSYVRLVRRLLHLGRGNEAREWIIRGINASGTTFPGVADELRTIQRGIWEKDGDRLYVAGERAGEFLEKPSFSMYQKLVNSAQEAGVWDDMKSTVMQFLETGKLPLVKGGGSSGKLFGVLPDTGLFPRVSKRKTYSPFFNILIYVAIAEKHPEDVLLWYDKLRESSRSRGFLFIPDDKVAEAVTEKFPERALAIWMEKAERLAAEGRPKSYESSIGYLRKIRHLMKQLGNEEEWGRYIVGIRTAHARKKKFLEMLDVFEGGKILKL